MIFPFTVGNGATGTEGPHSRVDLGYLLRGLSLCSAAPSEAHGKTRHPQLTSGGQLSPLLRLEGDDGVGLKGGAARVKSLPASWREQQGKVTPMASFLRSS